MTPIDDSLRERIERYLMGRMNAEERREFESALASDADLRAALEAERDLLSGLRQVGREAMKSEIRRRVAARRAEPAGGTMWLRAAAAIAVLAGTLSGFYYLTLRSDRQPSEPVARSEPAPPPAEETFGQGGAAATGPGAAEAEMAVADERDDAAPAEDVEEATPMAAARPPGGGAAAAGGGVTERADAVDNARGAAGNAIAGSARTATPSLSVATERMATRQSVAMDSLVWSDPGAPVAIIAYVASAPEANAQAAEMAVQKTDRARAATAERSRALSTEMDEGEELPDSMVVVVRYRDGARIALEWPAAEMGGRWEMPLWRAEARGDTVVVHTPDAVVYRIDVSRDTTVAVRRR